MKTRHLRALLVGAFLFALPCLVSPAFAGETLTSLLAKHARATAPHGTATHGVKALQTVYSLQAMGLTGTLTEWVAPPHKTRVEMELGPLHQTDADDGQTAWQQDSTGNVRIVRGAERTSNRAAAAFSIETYDPIKGAKQGKVTLRRAREPGTGNYILDVQPTGGTAQTVYLDPKTFLVRKLVSSKGGLQGTIDILAYQTVQGERVPSKLQIGYAGLPVTITAALIKATPLAKLDAALFTAPNSAQDYAFLTSPDAVSATIPFEEEHHEIVVPVVVNGQPHKFILDSGAGNSFITLGAAKALNLYKGADFPALGYGGTASSKIATKATVDLAGGVRLQNQNLFVIGDPVIGQALTERGGVDGGLGYDLFARFTVTIDYAHKTLTLTKPSAYTTPTAGVTALPIRLDAHTPTLTASVDGKTPGSFLVDTGDSGAIHLYAGYARANGLMGRAQDPGAQVQTSVGIGGPVEEVITPGHTLALGGVSIPGLAVATSTAAGVSSISQAAGGIGNQALHGFAVTFDYARARLLLHKAAPDAPVADVSREITLAAADTPATTEAVLARHLEALGGRAAVSAVKSTRVAQTVETGGIKGTVTVVYQSPDKEYEQDNLGIVNMTQGYDGKSAWQRDSNGNVRLLGEDERRELRLQLFIDTNSYVLPEAGSIPGKVSLRPQREPKTGNYVLDVTPEGGKPCVLFLDPKTFLIAKEEHLDDNVAVTTTFSDYRPVDGVRFPFFQRTTNGQTRYDVIARVTKLENNVSVADSLFSPPTVALGTKAMFVKPGAHEASVAFDFDDGEIAVPVRINGAASNVFLDSGASGLALSQKIADRLHLKQSGILEARGYGGSTDLHPVKIDTFEIPGAVRLSDLTAVAIKLPEGFDRTLNGPLAGFVGYDLLSRFVVRIDYGKRTVTFLDPATWTPAPSDGTPLMLNLDNDVPSITAQFENLAPAQFLLDTGDESALRLYGPYVTQNKLDVKYPKGIVSVGGGIGGESRSRVARTETFTVGGVTLRGIPTEFSQDAKGGASNILAGSLGSKLLSRFVVTFDYAHSRAFFAPTTGASEPFNTRSYGLTLISAAIPSLANNPQTIIVDVAPGSPAERAGVVVGDILLQIDGQSPRRLGLPGVRRLLSAEGTTASSRTLLLRSLTGRQRTVRVEMFDPLG